MPVPNRNINDKDAKELHPLTVHTVLGGEGNKTCTTVKVADDATVADVIDIVLDNLTIVAGSELFDLCEVFSECRIFPTDPDILLETSRRLAYSECPVSVVHNWVIKDAEDNQTETTKATEPTEPTEATATAETTENNLNGTITEAEETKNVDEHYRLYLTQKKGENRQGDVKITWLDGLNSKLTADEWHFDPFYREENEIDDLVNLPILDENVLLNELCKRFCKGRIYTYVGGILIAVNPFKYFPIYNPKYVNAYQHRKLGELPPHVFAIADAAYLRMLRDKQNQCIVISGESGSGKTESTKLILHHLTALSHKTKASLLEKTILAAGPVLEAFGNAKTFHNNNSSRFGKFTQINYRTDGVVCGAVLKKYLLEKSRIVAQSQNERNYHVFYYLLAGASLSERETLHLKEPEEYFYLNQTNCYMIEGNDEAYEFARLKNAIKNIGIHSGIQQRMFAVLSAVLHIGNISFKKRNYPDEAVSVGNENIIDMIAQLLQVEKQELIQPLTMRKTVTRGEEFIRNYKYDEAVATRDSMAKCLYASLFDWIVLQTNHIMVNRQGRKSENKAYSIGVLDIFGFEDFESNSFEQFCINLANENLQYYLNQHIFKLRQDEYVEEGLSWDHVDYVDNLTCLNLMVGKPTGLILLLDEECSLTMGTDDSLLDKFNRHHANSVCYEMPPTSQPVFSIVHYAGDVKYKIKGFRAKNRDLMRSDIVTAFKNSRMLFMRELMGSDPIAIYYWSILRHVVKAVALFRRAGEARAKGQKLFKKSDSINSITWAGGVQPNRRKSLLRQLTVAEPDPGQQAVMRRATRVMKRRVQDLQMKIQSPSRMRSGLEVRRTISGGMTEVSRRGGLKSPPTVVAQFQSSLQELMDTLNASHPFFVRCVRSNAQKAPLEFDAELVLRQLRYTGMLETVKIRQAGYPCRFLLQDFYSQFKLLFSTKQLNEYSDNLPKLLSTIGLDSDQFQVGTTKVFMREQQYQALRMKMQKKIDENARIIQCWIRSLLQHRRFMQMKEGTLLIQKIWRGYQCRLEYKETLRKHNAAKRIQEFWKSQQTVKFADTEFPIFKRNIISVQAKWRGYACRKRYLQMIKEKKEAEEQQEIVKAIPAYLETDVMIIPVLDGSPYSSRRKHQLRINENAEHLMNEVLKDTIFTQSDDHSDEHKVVEITDTDFTPVTESPETNDDKNKTNVPLYEEISNFAGIFAKQTEGTEQKVASVVKLRTEARDTPENLKQKLYRRLSFTAKDKRQATPPIKKAKEAEDSNGFEIIQASDFSSDKKAGVWNLQHTFGSTPTSSKSADTNKTSGFSSFINSLHRKGSKRELKSDKKARRGSNAGVDNENIVNSEMELEVFNNFLMRKVTDITKGDQAHGKQDTDVDVIFKNALHKYHGSLLFTCANSIQRKENISLKFHDIIDGFQEVLDQMVNQDEKVSKEFSIMGCNLFRGIIEEFQKNKDKLVLKRKQHKPYKRKRRKTLEFYEHRGHIYTFQNFNIRTYCEFCNSFIYDRGLTCQSCNFTCHKKCHTKYPRPCKGRRPSVHGPSSLFGYDLSEITSPNNPIPLTVIKLMLELEKRGLYAVGLYRKPGLQAAINNLKSVLTSTDADDVILEDERPHTISSVIKLFFRQLPKPVIPPAYYEDFMRCTDLEKDAEMHATMYDLIQKFSKENRELLERIIIHLSRVAMLEEHNKMSPNALAIVWAPCLMRCPDDVDPFESLKHVTKQTKCIETLIGQQVKSGIHILNDIDALHRATSTAEKRLDYIINERASRDSSDDMTDDASASSSRRESTNTEEIELLQKVIINMEDERFILTANLANIQPAKSRSMDSLDDLGSENDFEIIRGGSDEDITDTDEKSKTSTADKKRLQFADEGHESSYEDIPEPTTNTEETNAELK